MARFKWHGNCPGFFLMRTRRLLPLAAAALAALAAVVYLRLQPETESGADPLQSETFEMVQR